MALRREIRDEIEAAHLRDEKAAENEKSTEYKVAALKGKNAASYLTPAEWETKYGKENIDRYLNQQPETSPNTTVPNTANQAAVDKASKDLVSKDLMDEYLNRGKFSYNAAADPLYQQYRQKYLDAGQIAMKDTLGKATALTGGYGNSYANAVAQQTYDEYAARAADKIPELYQLALDRYDREGQELLNKYELLHGVEREGVEDERYQQEFDFKREQFDWSKLVDRHSMDLADKEFEESKNQFWANFDLNTRMYELDKWAKENQIQISWEELKQAAQAQSFDQAYKMLTYNRSVYESDRDYNRSVYESDRNYALSSYKASNSGGGGGGGGGGNTTTEKPLLSYFNNKQENLDKEVGKVAEMILSPKWTRNAIYEYLENNYGEDVGARIFNLAEIESQVRDVNKPDNARIR